MDTWKEIKQADEELQVAVEKRVAAGSYDLKDILVRMIQYVPDCGFPENVRPAFCEPDMAERLVREYRKGVGLDDPELPFFSETYLYELLGKEDARTILAFLGSLARAMGYKDGLYGLERELRDDKKRLGEHEVDVGFGDR